MKPTLRQFKQIFVTLCLFVFMANAYADKVHSQPGRQTREFSRTAAEAKVTFILPEGFREIPVQQEDPPLDYAMSVPSNNFEIWFSVKSYRYLSKYYRSNPDSAYLQLAKDQINSFSADNDYFVRNLSPRVLNQYNADEGKSYLVNLSDDAETHHYRYALIIVLQKNKVGSILAVCLTNDKGPEFFKSIDKARGCIKFKS